MHNKHYGYLARPRQSAFITKQPIVKEYFAKQRVFDDTSYDDPPWSGQQCRER